jgi:tetratricopeptide (TPR) repeat protein
MNKIFLSAIQFILQPWILILVAVPALYHKCLAYELTFLDDNIWLLDYAWYLGRLENIKTVFQNHDFITRIFYRPVLNISFMLNCAVVGSKPFLYHLTNIGIHTLNTCLVYGLFRLLGYSLRLSLSWALMFGFHPALTMSVVWIPGRTDSLLGTFVFLGFIFFLLYRKHNQAWWLLLLHALFLMLGLLTKETAIALPVLCALYLIMIERPARIKMIFIPFVISWMMMVGGWFFVRSMALKDSPPVPFSAALDSLLENAPSIISYFGKIFWFGNLSVLPVLKDISNLYGLIAGMVVVSLLVLSKNKRLAYISFGLMWFLLFLIPSLVLSFIKHEYRLYLPMVGIFFVLYEIDWIKKLEQNTKLFWTISVVVWVLLGWKTWHQGDYFRNKEVFWTSAVKTSPHSPLAHRNLGAMYFLQEKFDQAKVEFEKSLELNPLEQMAHNNLGLIYMRDKKYRASEREFLAEIKNNPYYDNVYYNLGILYFNMGRYTDAQRAWRKTLELNPKFVKAYTYLLRYYAWKKDRKNFDYYMNQAKELGIPLSPPNRY